MEKEREHYESPRISKREVVIESVMVTGSAVIWSNNKKVEIIRQSGGDNAFDQTPFEIDQWDD